MCLQIFCNDPVVAFNSKHWLEVSEATVKDLLGAEIFPVSEIMIIMALEKWGEVQVETDHGPNSSEINLRSKIDSALPLIRFHRLTCKEFANACLWLQPIITLTDREKSSILISLTLQSPSLMPPNFSQCLTRGGGDQECDQQTVI